MFRSHYCGTLTSNQIGQQLALCGWVHRRRDHGGLIFIDLRDHTGLVQLVFHPGGAGDEAYRQAHNLRSEYVIAVSGAVAARPPGTENPSLPTGQVEVSVQSLEVLNAARTPPFEIDADQETEVAESTRFRYRYLDLRRPAVQGRIRLRHRLTSAVRRALEEQGFIEVETPILTRSTPEGARDYLVPSRVNPGLFYALPQSPQLFKQLLMIGGIDRYYQIARCFRDEDLRADRQPEFTQIDIEMSFLSREEIITLAEGVIARVVEEVGGIRLPQPFPRFTYDEARARYGTDKPDLRFGMALGDLSSPAAQSDFGVFARVLEQKGAVKGFSVPGGAAWSRSELDALTEEAKALGAAGLVWVKMLAGGRSESPVKKYLSDAVIARIREITAAGEGDLVVIVADRPAVADTVLGALRVQIARRRNLVPAGAHRAVWVVDFPLVEYDETEQRLVAVHHPFTAPREEDLSRLEGSPLEVRSEAYDLVLDGTEIGGGSVRNHRLDIQMRLFQVLGITEKAARQRFGFLLEALEHGAPPHGGIAFGLDRLAAILAGQASIREVIAFPKTQKAICPLTEAPAAVDPSQLKELHIRIERSEETR